MNRSQKIAIYDQEQRRDVAFPGTRRDEVSSWAELLPKNRISEVIEGCINI